MRAGGRHEGMGTQVSRHPRRYSGCRDLLESSPPQPAAPGPGQWLRHFDGYVDKLVKRRGRERLTLSRRIYALQGRVSA